jgi:hypothetical protein
MNTKPFAINVGFAGLSLALASVGCSGAGGDGSQVQGEMWAEQETQVEQPERATEAAAAGVVRASSHSQVIHATISLGEDHVVQFVEHFPGAFGLIEMGRTMIDVPRVTPEVEKLSWRDQYRHFAGAAASLPNEMELALERAARAPRDMVAELPTELLPAELLPPTALPAEANSAPHFYTVAEQTWFNQTFCNGADLCAQGAGTVHMQTPHKINHYSVLAMIGAEGTANGRLKTFYWACGGGLFWPTLCYWFENGSALIVPGHFIHSTMSQQSSSWFFRWEVGGSSGANTLVSGSADF